MDINQLNCEPDSAARHECAAGGDLSGGWVFPRGWGEQSEEAVPAWHKTQGGGVSCADTHLHQQTTVHAYIYSERHRLQAAWRPHRCVQVSGTVPPFVGAPVRYTFDISCTRASGYIYISADADCYRFAAILHVTLLTLSHDSTIRVWPSYIYGDAHCPR